MGVTAESLMVEVKADVGDALAKLKMLDKQTASSGKTAGLARRGMAAAFGGTAILGGIAKTISLAKNFDATMRGVGVQTGQSGKQIDGLRKLALKMGKDTVYSAQDAGNAMLELAKGGLSAADIRAGALKTTLKLAAAGGIDMATAAGDVAQGLNTFGLKAKQASVVATALAGGANASTASVDSLGQALSQVGPGAKQAGLSLQETVAALSDFAQNGIQGSDAGTSLKTMLQRLVPQTARAAKAMKANGLAFTNADGSFKSLAQISQTLKDHLGKLSAAQRTQALNTIFGSDASRAAAVLMDSGRKGIEKYIKATNDQSRVQKMANVTMQGASGAWENLKGSAETAAIEIGTKLLPAFTKASNWAAKSLVPSLTAAASGTVDFAASLKPVAQEVGSVAKAVGSVVGVFGGLPGPVKSATAELAAFALIWPRLTRSMAGMKGSVAASFGNLAPVKAYREAVGQVTTSQATLRTATTQVTVAQTEQASAALRARDAQAALISTTAKRGAITDYVQANENLSKAQANASTAANALATAQRGRLTAGFKAAGAAAKGLAGPAGLLLLVSSAQQSSAAVSTAMGTIGGAVTGFAAGGPIGAAIGGFVGLLASIKGAGDRAADGLRNVQGQAEALKDTLNQTTGAITSNTRAMLAKQLADSGAYDAARTLGVGLGDVTKAALGNLPAVTRVGQRMNEVQQAYTDAGKKMPASMQKAFDLINNSVIGTSGTLGAAKRHILDTAAAMKQINAPAKAAKKALQGFQGNYKAYLSADDKASPKAQAAKKRADLFAKKYLASLLAKDGASGPTAKAQRAAATFARAYLASLSAKDQTGPGVAAAKRAIASVRSRTVSITTVFKSIGAHPGDAGRARNDVGPKTASGGMFRGARGVGVPRVIGEAGTEAVVPLNRPLSQVDPSVRTLSAFAQGKLQGMAKGGTVGHHKSTYGNSTIKDLANGVRGAIDGAKVLQVLQRAVRRRMSGGEEKAWLKRLDKMATKVEKATAVTKRLDAAKARLSDLRQSKADFADQVKTGISSQANVLNSGATAGDIRTSLETQVGKAKAFAANLQKLRKMGYSGAIIQQVAAAGIEGGYDVAAALAAANPDDVKGITSAFGSINTIAGTQSKLLSGQMFDAGIQAAEGIVKGLKKRRGAIMDAMKAIAVDMAKALRKALKIKSPSKVTEMIGDYTGRGLVVGLKGQTRAVSRAGVGLGTAAVTGMSSTRRPTLDNLTGGSRAGASVSFTFHAYNPVAEPASRTTNKALARVASLGLV